MIADTVREIERNSELGRDERLGVDASHLLQAAPPTLGRVITHLDTARS